MFLALTVIIFTFLSPCFVPAANCGLVYTGSGYSFINNGSSSETRYPDFLFAPLTTVSPFIPSSHLHSEDYYPHLLISPRNEIFRPSDRYKNDTGKDVIAALLQSRGPARLPQSPPTKDYGKASHYRMKDQIKELEGESTSKRNFYISLLRKLLRPSRSRSRSSSHHHEKNTRTKHSSPSFSMTSTAHSAPAGWGKGWGKGGGGHGVSGVDVLLCALSLLSLGGFLLNLLLNLLNLFGFGFATQTSTYPVTVTETATAPTGTGGKSITIPTKTTAPTGTGTGITIPTLTGGISAGVTGGVTGGGLTTGVALSDAGLGFTGRSIDSMVGNRNQANSANGNGWGWGWGWGWKEDEGRIKLHIQLPTKGWSTTTTPSPLLQAGLDALLGAAGVGRNKPRRKRETFQPYVNPSTALEILAKAVLNSINAATNEFECIEQIFCESNKQARVIGQGMEYFMPLYSFSLSYFGHKVGAHVSLLDHLSAIMLGAAEINCQTHFPRCGDSKKS